jgi:hypothetical protein
MPQGFCTLTTVPEPFTLSGGGTTTARVTLIAPVTVIWATGSPDTWKPAPSFTILPAASYGVVGLDTTVLVWNLVAVQGHTAPVLVHEADYLTPGWDTVLGGTPTWAVLRRIEGVSLSPVPQV